MIFITNDIQIIVKTVDVYNKFTADNIRFLLYRFYMNIKLNLLCTNQPCLLVERF